MRNRKKDRKVCIQYLQKYFESQFLSSIYINSKNASEREKIGKERQRGMKRKRKDKGK